MKVDAVIGGVLIYLVFLLHNSSWVLRDAISLIENYWLTIERIFP